jgi:hypothetical protein
MQAARLTRALFRVRAGFSEVGHRPEAVNASLIDAFENGRLLMTA